MGNRNTLLIGSMPFEDERDAMTKALDKLGDTLNYLPDGEIGERTEKAKMGKRSTWIVSVFERTFEDPDTFEVKRDMERNAEGRPADYDKVPRFQPKYPPGKLLPHLDLGYLEYFVTTQGIVRKIE